MGQPFAPNARLKPRDFHSHEGIDERLQSLDDRWPARTKLSKHIVAQIEALPTFDPHVVELAPGGGKLADQILRALPTTYTGIDFSEPLIERARERLLAYGNRVTLFRAGRKPC